MTLPAPGESLAPAQVQSLVTLNRALMIQHLLRGIAHDIRNNLQVVALGSSLGDDAGSPAIALRVERSLDGMVVSLDLLSRLGKSAADDPPGSDLGEALAAVGELADLQRNLPTLRLKVGPPATPAMVAIPRADLIQVLLNLVANAKEAAVRPTDSVEMSATMPMDGRVGVSIDDSGPGIPPGFGRPFSTTKDPSLHGGLGLFVSRVLVERVGGELSWHPRPEGGTRVRVVLPIIGRG